jgi:hypothetical protein
MAEEFCFVFGQGQEIFFATEFRPALGLFDPYIQWLREAGA